MDILHYFLCFLIGYGGGNLLNVLVALILKGPKFALDFLLGR